MISYAELKALNRKKLHLPKERRVQRTIQTFSLAERAVFYILVLIFIATGFSLLWQTSNAYLVDIPTSGGSLTEGVIGNPRFINPVLALSEADKNLSSLIYSGLLDVTPEGKVENDLAEKVEISEDRLTYTVRIKGDAQFHDGAPVTTEDVLFTIQKITDPLIKSPRRGNWEGVTVNIIDEREVSFVLKKPYTPFIYNLSIGILPKHIWKNVTADEFSFSQFNTLPVGSGPYKIEKVERNEGGIPNFYHLTYFGEDENRPYIKNFNFRFYSSEEDLLEAYNNGEVESLAGLSPEKLSTLELGDAQVLDAPLPRVFAVFFNQSHSAVLLDKSVRKALSLSAPRPEIVEEVFKGYATPIDGPLPAGVYPWTTFESASSTEERLTEAKSILEDAGWTLNNETGVLEKKSGNATMSLSFSISTGDAPELRQVAEKLSQTWQKLGAKVELLVFETGELNQNVIRPRNFDALLFGEMVGRDADLYPFWHSSQRVDPGLNIALYTNSQADKLLEEARTTGDDTEIEKGYQALVQEISADHPAVFLYTPSFLYLMPKKVKAVSVSTLLSAQDRFAGIEDWYIETDRVWRIFLNN